MGPRGCSVRKLYADSIARFFVAIAIRHPFAVVTAAALGVVLSLLLAATRLELDTSRLGVSSAGKRYKQVEAAHSREFEEWPDKVVVVIRDDNPERAKAFATTLAQRWQTDPHIEKVLYRVDADALKNKALVYLTADELVTLRQKLEEHRELLEELAASPTIQNLLGLINRKTMTTLVSRVFTDFLEDEPRDEPLDLGFLLSLLRQMNQWMVGPRVYHSPWGSFFGQDATTFSQDGFLWSDDKQLLFVLTNPRAEAGHVSRFKRALETIRGDVREIHQQYSEAEVGITGTAILESEEMMAAQRDTTVASVIAAVGVVLLYFALFRGIVRPLLALATLLIGVSWSLGFTTATIGHLNIFSIAFMPMLVGLGIDYGSYFIARYEEGSAAGGAVQGALVRTCRTTCPGIATAALTTALSFGALTLTGSTGVAELGFIGGSGILLILLATFTVLPALLLLHGRRRQLRSAKPERRLEAGRRGYLEPLYRYPWVTLAASALLTGLCLWALGRVGSDFNLLHLQDREAESVIWEHRIFDSAKQSMLFGELVAGSRSEVERKVEALKALPSVASVDSIVSVIPADQERKLQLIRGLRPVLADLVLPRVSTQPVDLGALGSTLDRIKFKMAEGGEGEGDPKEQRSRQQRQEVRGLIDQFVTTTGRMDKAEVLEALSAFQTTLVQDLAEKLAVLKANLTAKPVTIADLPPELRMRYVGKGGQYRLFVFPSENVWEFPPLARFVRDIRSVDPDALGTPVLNFEFTRGIREAYAKAGLYAVLGIVALTLLAFRAVGPTLVAFSPLAVGTLWALGFMGLFGVKFNVANLIVIPLIIAPAVESGIMIVQRYREESRRAETPLPLPKSTGRAVAFSALSTIVGFGSLMISRHAGIFSIGLILAVGVSAVLLASFTVLPSLLALLSARANAKRFEIPAPVGLPHPQAFVSAVDHRLGPTRKSDLPAVLAGGATTEAKGNQRRAADS